MGAAMGGAGYSIQRGNVGDCLEICSGTHENWSLESGGTAAPGRVGWQGRGRLRWER